MRNLSHNNVVIAPPELLNAEVVVIGSGPGGATAALTLTEAGRNVLLLEEGPYLDGNCDDCPPFSREEMVMKYRNGGVTVALGSPKVAYAEGKCVGGGSEINGGLWHRTPDYVLEEWKKAYDVEALSEKDLRPHFEQCEKELAVCFMQDAFPPASLKLLEGAQKLNWRAIEVPRCCSSKTDNGLSAKRSMTKTLIPRALNQGLMLLPNTKVTRLERRNGSWNIIGEHKVNDKARRSFQSVEIRAKNVFVAGGAIQTPTLLKRSGIEKNIGANLRFHPAIKVLAKFKEEVNGEDMGIPVHQVSQFAPRFRLGCSASTLPHLSISTVDYPQHLLDLENEWRHMAVYYAMIPGGLGTVSQLPIFKDPVVRYSLTNDDLKVLAEALTSLCKLLFAAGAELLLPSIAGVRPIASMADLDSMPRVLSRSRTMLISVHLFATCPMGENKVRCAVNSFGKVHGIEGLYVADASLLCGPTGVNPQGSIMAVVRRNTMHFLGKL